MILGILCNANHISRVFPLRLSLGFAQDFDALLRRWIVKHLNTQFEYPTWDQVKRRLDDGGYGLGNLNCTAYSSLIDLAVSVFNPVQNLVSNPSISICDSSSSTWIRDIWSFMEFLILIHREKGFW